VGLFIGGGGGGFLKGGGDRGVKKNLWGEGCRC